MSKRKPKQVHNRGANGRFIPVGRKGLIVHGKDPAPKRRDRSLSERLVGVRDESRRWNSVLGKRIEEVDAKILKLWTSRQIDGAELAEWRRTTNNLVDQLDTGLHRLEERLKPGTEVVDAKTWTEWSEHVDAEIDKLATKVSQLDNLRSVDDTRLRHVETELKKLGGDKEPGDIPSPPAGFDEFSLPRDEASVWWKAFWGAWEPKDRPLTSAISIATNMVDELRRLGKLS